MPDDQFSFLKSEIAQMRLDIQALSTKIASIHQHLGVCQSRCHVPGPPPTLRSLGRHLMQKIIEKLQ
jgi:hypothetical protein